MKHHPTAIFAALAATLATAAPAQAQTAVTLWVHAGPGPEANAYVAAAQAFNDKARTSSSNS